MMVEGLKYKDERQRMKDEKKRGMPSLRDNIHAAPGLALAVNQAGCVSQPDRFFHPFAFIPHPL
jgi:hypothetical protein